MVSGDITAALGVGFLVAHAINPFLSSASYQEDQDGIVIGVCMITWGRRRGSKKYVKQVR